MSILGLLIAILATGVVVWLVQQNRIPSPFHWICYAVLVVVWIFVLVYVTPVGDLFLNRQVG